MQTHLHTSSIFFFFNDTATTEIYTLSLHDALPIYQERTHEHDHCEGRHTIRMVEIVRKRGRSQRDRKSTRLNSSHLVISYAVFCLKKKKKQHLKRKDAARNKSTDYQLRITVPTTRS